MVVFGPPPYVEAFSLFFAAMQAAASGFTAPQSSPLFSLQDPEELRREMAAAGLKDIRVETVNHGMDIQSATHSMGPADVRRSSHRSTGSQPDGGAKELRCSSAGPHPAPAFW